MLYQVEVEYQLRGETHIHIAARNLSQDDAETLADAYRKAGYEIVCVVGYPAGPFTAAWT